MTRQWLFVFAGCSGLLLIGAIALALLVLFFPAVKGRSVIIGPNERGIVLAPYLQPSGEVLEPGRHWLKPGEKVEIIVISRQTYGMSAASSPDPDAIRAKTSDGHEVDVDVSIVYAVDPNKVVDLFTSWQNRYQDNLVRPLTRSITRDALSQYSADDLIGSKRADVQRIIRDELKMKFVENNLLFFDYVILDIRQAN